MRCGSIVTVEKETEMRAEGVALLDASSEGVRNVCRFEPVEENCVGCPLVI